MFIAGLTSVTFRLESAEAIVKYAAECQLKCIEWGGDIHVPAGNVEMAKSVAVLTKSSNLYVSSYGSYYSLLDGKENFDKVLQSAVALNAPIIRIWGGRKSPSQFSETEYAAIVADCRYICERAKKNGIKIALECHNRSITENKESTVKFLKDVGHDNLYMYWQPNQYLSFEENLAFAEAVKDYTVVIHVFHWQGDKRFPLCEGADMWKQYFAIFKNVNRDIPCLLEFMHDESVKSLLPTVETLRLLIER